MKWIQTMSYLLMGTLPLAAQDEIKHTLRVLPLGDPPPFVQEVRDGARYEVAAPTGTIPPRMVMIPSPAKPGALRETGPVPLRLRLGRPSAPVTLPAPQNGRIALQLEQGSNWLSVPLHPCGSSLALVWRWGKNWNDARTLVLPDDVAARAEGNVHVTNLSGSTMGVVIGLEKIRLEPGKTYTRHLTAESAPVTFEILYASPAGELKLCHATQLSGTRGNFCRVLIYAADGEHARMPVKVLQLDEPS